MNVLTLRLRPLALAAFTAVVVLALQAAPAMADTATFEQPAGPAANAMDTIYRAVLGVTVTIFVLVGGWLLYSALRFRVRPGEPDIEPPQVRGSTRLEIGWTLAPVLVLAALAGYTIDHIPAVKDAPSDAMVVNVLAQQWSFSYVYGHNSGISGKAPSGTGLPFGKYFKQHPIPGVCIGSCNFQRERNNVVIGSRLAAAVRTTSVDVIGEFDDLPGGGREQHGKGRRPPIGR